MDAVKKQGQAGAVPEFERARARTRMDTWAPLALLSLSTLVLTLVIFQSLPVSTTVPGIMWPEDGAARLRVEREGVVESILVKQNAVVKLRQPLFVIRHRLVPLDEIRVIRDRETALTERLTQTQKAIAAIAGAGKSSPRTVELIKLEDQLSESLVETRDKLLAIRNESTSVMYAPRAGQVIELRALVGGEVQPNQSLATITTALPKYGARAYVTSDVAARLKSSGDAEVEIKGASGQMLRMKAKVARISPLPVSPRDVDRSIVIKEPLYEVDVAFVSPKGLPQGAGSASPGRPVAVVFKIDERSLLAWMLSRFTS